MTSTRMRVGLLSFLKPKRLRGRPCPKRFQRGAESSLDGEINGLTEHRLTSKLFLQSMASNDGNRGYDRKNCEPVNSLGYLSKGLWPIKIPEYGVEHDTRPQHNERDPNVGCTVVRSIDPIVVAPP